MEPWIRGHLSIRWYKEVWMTQKYFVSHIIIISADKSFSSCEPMNTKKDLYYVTRTQSSLKPLSLSLPTEPSTLEHPA